MTDIIIFFLLISSGSILCSTLFNKKYEEILPITCSCIVLILFGFGLCNGLDMGAIAVCVLSFSCYVVAGIWMIKNRNIKNVIKNTLTNGFFVFLVLSAICTFSIYGKVLHSWDEFTHWGDIVKAMVTIDDFGTNPLADAAFQSYPPGMSLFQYMLQKLYVWKTGEIFSEWRLYIAYQMFAFSFIVPIFNGKIKKNIFCTVVSMIIVFLAPLMFYEEFYSTLYIDPFLSVLSGAGLAMVLWTKEKDLSYSLRIFSICSMLVLAKDAGILFAVVLGITYLADALVERKRYSIKALVGMVGGTAVAIVVPEILWNLEIKLSNANKSFSNPIEFEKLLKIVLFQDDTYRDTVWRTFCKSLFVVPIEIGETSVEVNYFSLILVFILIISILIKCEKKKENIIISAVVAQTLIYVFGLAVTYIFKFSEYEALRLASYDRYMNIHYCAVWIFIVLSIVHMLYNICEEKKNTYALAIGVLIVVIAPTGIAYGHVIRETVQSSVGIRWEYNVITDKVERLTESTDKIYVIAEGNNGFDKWVLKHSFRPRKINANEWSIGESFYDDDVWTVSKTAGEWMDELCDEYDYVVLYKINDYFIENYGELFGNGQIVNNGVYRVNKQSQTLEFVE